MITQYLSICKSIGLQYIDSYLDTVVILMQDKVSVDALRHEIELNEDDMNLTYWMPC
jgi:hypothetical protein